MAPRCWIGLLLASVSCAAPPDVVAIGAAASTATGGAAGAGGEGGADAEVIPLEGAVEGHDPSALFDGDQLWIVSGGSGVLLRTSADLRTVGEATNVFVLPAWAAEKVPDAQSIWSPELAYFGGSYHVYYAVSTLGATRSCIGHATTDALALDSTWVDRGSVVCSNTGDSFNAIDPNVLQTSDGGVWLAYGSYATGIKLVQLDADGTAPIADPVAIAARPDDGGALQAPALAEHGGYYYLFVSFGHDATHSLMVGRAEAIEGPYVDRSGRALLEGGGDPVFQTSARFVGAGSNDVFAIGEQSYNVFDAYDQADGNRMKLRLATMTWDSDGWPVSGGP